MDNILGILGIPFSIMLFGTRLMRRVIYESLLKDVDKKDLLNYLVQNRIFIESLSDEEILNNYKAFKLYNRNRKIKRLKKFLKIKDRED
mgnify:FL=1|jgi:hypothetical protein